MTLHADLGAALAVADELGDLDVAAVAHELYGSWYVRPQPAEQPEGPPTALDVNLADVLRAAHAAGCRGEDGWVVQALSNRGRAGAVRGAARRVVDRADYVAPERPFLPPRVGDPVRVAARRDAVTSDGGAWLAFGGDWDETAPLPSGCVRLYWDVPLAHAVTLVAELTARLAGTAYALKLPASPAGYARADVAVTYLEDVDAAGDALRGAYERLRPLLRPAVPRLTLRLGPGLALAEDPGTGESFGEHRCRLVAAAARATAGTDAGARLDAVVRRLADSGVDPRHPYRRAGSTADYRALEVGRGR